MLNKELLVSTLAPFGLEIDEGCFKRLDTYAEMLVKTNESFNLTAITEPDDVTLKHFADCLVLLKYLDIKNGAKVIDVGTGAGFPGLVLLLARPDLKMTFLDSTRKKLGFIGEVLEACNVNAELLHMRAEEAGQSPEYRERFDLTTARAVSNMTNLSEYCLPFLKMGGRFAAMKSAETTEELLQAKKAIGLLGGKTEKEIDFNLTEGIPRKIIILKKISQTPTKYPRPSAKIAKNPII
ncbi:MAG: 16S rRNA (guanine(527)-N(7))-methyltransferase RsmG [Clostridia bacterium]|nr:16S rRNA (guanine(527)-N(7))-methyltransferase RsmG [Clostridia bacterium]